MACRRATVTERGGGKWGLRPERAPPSLSGPRCLRLRGSAAAPVSGPGLGTTHRMRNAARGVVRSRRHLLLAFQEASVARPSRCARTGRRAPSAVLGRNEQLGCELLTAPRCPVSGPSSQGPPEGMFSRLSYVKPRVQTRLTSCQAQALVDLPKGRFLRPVHPPWRGHLPPPQGRSP